MNPLRRYRASSPEGGALCAVEEKKTFCLQEKLADSQGKSSPFEERLPPGRGEDVVIATKGGIWHRAAMAERVIRRSTK